MHLSHPILDRAYASGGKASFGVSYSGGQTVRWTARITKGRRWVRIVSALSGSNDGTIELTAARNTSDHPREGVVRVTAFGAENTTLDVIDVRVIQAASLEHEDDENEENDEDGHKGDDVTELSVASPLDGSAVYADADATRLRALGSCSMPSLSFTATPQEWTTTHGVSQHRVFPHDESLGEPVEYRQCDPHAFWEAGTWRLSRNGCDPRVAVSARACRRA